MRSYLLGVWNIIDPIYYLLTRLHYVPGKDEENRCIFRVRLTRYKGSRVTLSDGTVIKKNDILLKIHLHNVRLIQNLQPVTSDMKRAAYTYHVVKQSLSDLARYLYFHPKHEKIKGVIGITTLHKGANRLGFEVVPFKNEYYRIYKRATFMPINFLANTMQHKEPVYLFMSKQSLIDKHR